MFWFVILMLFYLIILCFLCTRCFVRTSTLHFLSFPVLKKNREGRFAVTIKNFAGFWGYLITFDLPIFYWLFVTYLPHFFPKYSFCSLFNELLLCQKRSAKFELLFHHGDIILNRSNNSVFLRLKIYWNRQTFDLIRASGIWVKPETLRYQASSSKF